MMRTLAHVVSCFTDAFGYDALGQVVSARFGEGSDPDLYDYDLIGNFTSNRLRGAWTQFDANELNEYATLSTPSTSSTPSTLSTSSTLSTPSTSSTTALSYDPDGNLLTNGVWSYAYDSMNRLSAAASNGVAVAEYAYDAFWRRVGRRAGGAEHRNLYNDWNPIRESISTGAGTAACDYHWGKDLSGTFQGAGGVGGLLAVRRADGLFLNSPIRMIDPTGLAYGNPLVNQDGIPIGSGWGELWKYQQSPSLECCGFSLFNPQTHCCFRESPNYDCRTWARHRIRECMEKSRRDVFWGKK